MQSNKFNYLFLDKDIISLVWNKYLAAALKRNASFEYIWIYEFSFFSKKFYKRLSSRSQFVTASHYFIKSDFSSKPVSLRLHLKEKHCC